MCKFTKPTIPADATADERRSLMFDAMYSADLSEETEKKSNLTYLSWSQAWKVFKQFYPSATYQIFTNPNTGLPVFESELGLMVHTAVEADGITYEDWLPVMDYANRAMKSVPYTVQVYDKQNKQYVEKRVEAATTFDVNSSIQRSMVRAIARHGLGLYIYNGFDHINEDGEPQIQQTTNNGGYQQKNNGGYQRQQYNGNRQQYNRPASQPQSQMQVQQPQTTASIDPLAGIKNAINGASDVTTLMSLYLDHQGEIEANPNIKQLLTNRKLQLQAA
ncbi:MAG: DUF1071 domain-containing protein [Prevotella sp.]|nr:DUF1071 domain-containing protein [Candidatus Prevotella equi]